MQEAGRYFPHFLCVYCQINKAKKDDFLFCLDVVKQET